MPTARLFLIRHALVEPSARATLYGDADVALCALALAADAACYRWLARRLPSPALWVTTPLQRTRHTADAIFAAATRAPTPEVEPALAEQHLGAWQGITHEALTERLSHPPHPFWPHGADERPPGGESISDVIARVGPVLERLADRVADGDAVVVAHGGTIRAAIAHAMGLSAEQALRFSVKNLSLTRLERQGQQWRVASVNEEPFA
jgi:broad specificity phosphatase PhoE